MLQKNSQVTPYERSEDDESGSVADSAMNVVRLAGGILRRQWILILATTALFLAIAIIYLIVTPPVFSARAILIIDAKKEPSFQQQSAQSSDAPLDSSFVSSQVEILKSDNIARAVLKKLNLTNNPEPGGDGSGSVSAPPSMITEEDKKAALRREMISVRSLVGNLTITRVGLTYIIEIAYRSLDPDRAAQVANAVADAYITDQLNAKYEAARRAAVWLQDRINELHDQVAAAETAIVDFRKKHNLVMTGGADNRLLGQQEVKELNTQLVTAGATTAEAKARLDRINEILSSGSVNATVTDTLKSDVVSKLRSQYFDLSLREADWSSRYGKDHLAAVNLRKQMQDIKDAIFEEVKRLGETYKSDLEIARQREADLRKELSRAVAQSQNSDSAEITLRQLEATAQSYKKLYDNFLQRYTESVQQQSFPISEARLISPATPPNTRSSPKRLMILELSCLVGSTLGFGIGWLRDRMDAAFRTTEDVEYFLGLDCLALVPRSSGIASKPPKALATKDDWRSLYKVLENDSPKKTLSGSSPSTGSVSGSNMDARASNDFRRVIHRDNSAIWAVSRQPLSVFTEALRALKLALDLNGLVRTSNVVGFTSSLPNEGKSTIAGALAQLMSLAGARCLLVDGDLRNPTLSRQLAQGAQAGLLEVLSGKLPLEDVVWKDNSTNMSFLPMVARSRLTNTSDILASAAVQQFFAKCRESYDYIIVDFSPISPVIDVRATARWVDAYVYIVEWGGTRPDLAKYALKNAPELREKILGAVLNKVDLNVLKRYGTKYKDYLSEKYSGRYVSERPLDFDRSASMSSQDGA
jgi:succinoglycan biosynthesis transport protein ExoP